jgi:hypothetical protein
MADGKLQVTIGVLTFSGEGEISWLTEQFDKVLALNPRIVAKNGQPTREGDGSESGDRDFAVPLAKHLRDKGAEVNQVRRFLATADWLRRRGAPTLTSSAVAKALSENQQKRLGNPADCLNKNVSKGHCEKKGEGFFITPDGLALLGYSD